MLSSLVYLILIGYVIHRVMQAGKKNAMRNPSAGRPSASAASKNAANRGSLSQSETFRSLRKMISDDGHVVPKSQDLTCETKHGHVHPKTGPRYIVHEEPEMGYVVLNGVKRSLKDCKNL